MGTVIRAKISKKNKYWIDKHRYYELKHFCLQYKEWEKAYIACGDYILPKTYMEESRKTNTINDVTSKCAVEMAYYAKHMEMVEKAAMEAEPELYHYLLKAVTEGLSYTYLKTKLDIPCSRDMYYDRYRKFFWILSNSRD